MNTNKMTVLLSVTIIFLIISIPTVYKVVKNHKNNLYKVTEAKIIGAAKKCYYDELCQEKNIYLKDLYAYNYLEKMSDPITKEYYNENSFVERKQRNFEFQAVE